MMQDTDAAVGAHGAVALGGAFDASVTGMAVVDREGRFTAVNAALCGMLGRARADLLSHRTADYTHPDDASLTATTIGSLLSGHQDADQVRKRFVRPDGSIVHVVRTTTVLRDECGRRTGMLSQMVDVTEVAAVEEALRRSEARLGVLLSHAHELTVLLDREGGISFASPSAERLLGYAPDTLVGLDALGFVHPDDLAAATVELAERLMGGEAPALPSVHRIKHREGHWWPAEIWIDDLSGDPAIGGLLVHLRDVTEQHAYRDQVAAGEVRLQSLIGNSWDVTTLHGADGSYLYASPAVTAQLGWQPEELLGAEPWTLVHPDDARAQAEWFATVGVAAGVPVQYRARHRDGTWRWVESTAANRLGDPAIGGVIVTTRDITARRRRNAQQEAIASLSGLAVRGGALRELFQRAVTAVAEVLGIDNCAVMRELPDGRFALVARHGPPLGDSPHSGVVDGTPVTMAARARAAGQPVTCTSDEGTSVFGVGDGTPSTRRRSGAATVIGSDGQCFGALTCYAARPDAFAADDLSFIESTANVLAAAIVRQRVEEELRRQASSDELTGLPNRIALRQRLATALDRAACVAVLLIDADDFKLVNDSLGHVLGDRVVRSVGERLVANLRRDDTVARLGGDEFVVLCEGASAADAERVAERLRGVLAAPMALDGRQLALTVSIGFVVGSGDCSPDDLVARADTAMYAAKKAGKDRIAQFDEAMRRSVTERLEVASGLRRAVAHDELVLHYQPVVDVASGTVIGAEALLRWQHPTDGLLPPGRFIGYAEESGLILPVGGWVLEHAMRQAAAWSAQGFEGRVAINVSARQLADADLVGTVRSALDRTGADPRRVALEVTESAVMSDVTRSAAVLGQLRSLGIHIGMDDFGTGHSSLSYLATLPFDFVKIDRSFVAHFDEERRAAALLETIATLCRTLELPAIAEGVETEEQLAEITRLGIAQVQGFLLGRPVPAADFRLPAAPRCSGGLLPAPVL